MPILSKSECKTALSKFSPHFVTKLDRLDKNKWLLNYIINDSSNGLYAL